MTKHNLILYSVIFILSSCKKDEKSNLIEQPAGIYESAVYLKTDIVLKEDIAFTTRPNYNSLQYTSENTKQSELNQSTLTPKMDIYTPPNANISRKQPLLVMIHGGGYSSGDKKAWMNEAYSYSRAGYICASLNYRLTQSGGNQDSLLRLYAVQCALEDIQNAIRFLKRNAETYFIDTTRIAVFGGSAGGGLALTNAIEFDATFGANDYPGFSSKTNCSISTGATLINDDPASILGALHYDTFDSPILLFHAKETDSSTGATWTNNVVPTQQVVNNSGNSCTIKAQPDMTHTVILELEGDYWSELKPFLWINLRLDDL